MLIPRGVLLERSFRTLVERGKVWVVSSGDCLRDVPDPRETVPNAKDLQSGSFGGRLSAGGNARYEPGRITQSGDELSCVVVRIGNVSWV